MCILSPAPLTSDTTSTVRFHRTCTYFHINPQHIVRPQQPDLLDMYILSHTPSACDTISTARSPRYVHTFTYALSVWYDLNSQISSICTYCHLHPQRVIRPQQPDLLDMYILWTTPSAYSTTLTARPPVTYTYKKSASGRNVSVKRHRRKRILVCKIFRAWPRHRHTGAHSLYIRYKYGSFIQKSWCFCFIAMSSTSSLRILLLAVHPTPCKGRIVILCFVTPHFTLPDIGSIFFQSISTSLSHHNTVPWSVWPQCDCSMSLNFKSYTTCTFQNWYLHTEFWWIHLRERDNLES